MKRTLGEFAQLTGGRLLGADAAFGEVLIDSRQAGSAALFVALRGERADGHDFVGAAAQRGAAGAVVSHAQPVDLPQILVADPALALARAAAAWRNSFELPLIGVAGSNGKTTVKEMLAAILLARGPCLATRGNLNNHLGVPLTLFRLGPEHRSAVVEMGANRAGDVTELVAIGRPTIGLITNAGAEHLEGFGSLEGVARAEGEMVQGLDSRAIAIINADDAFAALWRGLTGAQVWDFGLGASARFRAEAISLQVGRSGFTTRFRLVTPEGSRQIHLALAGQHNVINALAAAAAASAAGASLSQIAAGLRRVRAVRGRLQWHQTPGAAWIIDDSYNANPSSVRAGLAVLSEVPGRRWLVLGDMAELGAAAEPSHRQIGVEARAAGVERLWCFGPLAALAAETFGAGATAFDDVATLTAALQSGLDTDVRVLIKGSRVNRLERVVEALLRGPGVSVRKVG